MGRSKLPNHIDVEDVGDYEWFWEGISIGNCIICHEPVYAETELDFHRSKKKRKPVMHSACGW